MEYTKEQFRKQVAIGIEYEQKHFVPRWLRLVRRLVQPDQESAINHLTDHLWGTIGMVLNSAKQVGNREAEYNDSSRI